MSPWQEPKQKSASKKSAFKKSASKKSAPEAQRKGGPDDQSDDKSDDASREMGIADDKDMDSNAENEDKDDKADGGGDDKDMDSNAGKEDKDDKASQIKRKADDEADGNADDEKAEASTRAKLSKSKHPMFAKSAAPATPNFGSAAPATPKVICSPHFFHLSPFQETPPHFSVSFAGDSYFLF